MNFCLSGEKIRQITCTKYLGVLLDLHLLFNDHINFLKQKVNRVNGILSKLRIAFWYPKNSILLSFWYMSTLCMSGLRTKQQWHTSHGSKGSKQSPTTNKFQGRKTSNQSINHNLFRTKKYIYIYIYKSKLLSRANWILCIGTTGNSRWQWELCI